MGTPPEYPQSAARACSYTKDVNCAICGIRKPRRYCPGVSGQICSICCGTEREQSVDCPITCEYLREAHKHERPAPLDPASLPNQDIRVPESFVAQHEWLLMLLASSVAAGALKGTSISGATDFDIREGLESLVATYRSLQSGILYEAKLANPFAASIQNSVQTLVEDIRTRMTAAAQGAEVATPPMTLPDSTILALLVFLQRLEYSYNNGRKRSRAFLDFLMQFHTPAPNGEETVEPQEPMVIL